MARAGGRTRAAYRIVSGKRDRRATQRWPGRAWLTQTVWAYWAGPALVGSARAGRAAGGDSRRRLPLSESVLARVRPAELDSVTRSCSEPDPSVCRHDTDSDAPPRRRPARRGVGLEPESHRARPGSLPAASGRQAGLTVGPARRPGDPGPGPAAFRSAGP
jgi:hypothetical protein